MNRRDFIVSFFGAVIMAIVPDVVVPGDGVALRSIAHPHNPAPYQGVWGAMARTYFDLDTQDLRVDVLTHEEVWIHE